MDGTQTMGIAIDIAVGVVAVFWLAELVSRAIGSIRAVREWIHVRRAERELRR